MPIDNGIYTRFKTSSFYTRIDKLLHACTEALLSSIRSCDLCGQKAEHYSMLCNDCYEDIIKFNLPMLDFDLLNWPIFYRAIEPIKFDQLICVAPYQWPYSYWIRRLKYKNHFESANFLSELMFTAWMLNNNNTPSVSNNHKPETIINEASIAVFSVPMHINKWQERGYNQAYLLAQRFSQRAQVSHLSHLLVRCKATINQVGLNGVERRNNLKKAFALTQNIKLPEHIILIDDVLTTGSTANEITQLLKRHGVMKVTVLTLCLALPSHKISGY